MYFLNQPGTWLDKYLKSLVLIDPSKSHMVNGPNTGEIFTTAPLSYLLIIVKAIGLEKVSLSYMQNIRTLC